MTKQSYIVNGTSIGVDSLLDAISHFTAYVSKIDRSDAPVSFTDMSRYLGREENFKMQAFINAREALKCKTWESSDIGSGKIADCAMSAMKQAGKLVYHDQQRLFQNRIFEDINEAERILYSLYCEERDEESFNEAKTFWGGRYDLIAYLFFIKGDTIPQYLPISPNNFDKSFRKLGINFHTSNRCSWENYQKFIAIIDCIRAVMTETMPLECSKELRLIDAHSFLWILTHEDYDKWQPSTVENKKIEKNKQSGYNVVYGKAERKERKIEDAGRDSNVSEATKERAKGICQLCGNNAPFVDKRGKPFLECHHIIWRAFGGEDNTNNTVALCPNCHRKMHILALEEDVEYLLSLKKT